MTDAPRSAEIWWGNATHNWHFKANGVTQETAFTASDPRIEIIPESGCWIWMMGATNRWGYGRISLHRHGAKVCKNAHRVAWEATNGRVPDGMQIDHKCRVRCCVNPYHLRVVTPSQNYTENCNTVCAIHARKTACPKCGGAYTKRRQSSGRFARICIPCTKKQQRNRWLRRRAEASCLTKRLPI